MFARGESHALHFLFGRGGLRQMPNDSGPLCRAHPIRSCVYSVKHNEAMLCEKKSYYLIMAGSSLSFLTRTHELKNLCIYAQGSVAFCQVRYFQDCNKAPRASNLPLTSIIIAVNAKQRPLANAILASGVNLLSFYFPALYLCVGLQILSLC